MILVSNDEFKEMFEKGFVKQNDYAVTMKNHSKSKRHKHYVREDKYEKYLRHKANLQNKINSEKDETS